MVPGVESPNPSKLRNVAALKRFHLLVRFLLLLRTCSTRIPGK